MKNRFYGIMVLAIIAVLIISLTMVMAVPNNTANGTKAMNQTKMMNGSGNGTKAPGKNLNKNMTYGQCVDNFAKAKNTCFENGKKNLEACKKNAEKSKNLTMSEKCTNNNGKTIEKCKTTYKASKEGCKKYKRAFMDYLMFWK